MFVKILSFFGLFFATNAVYKPKYIIPCSRSNNFDECAVKNAQHAIPFIINGDKRLKIPSLNPLKVQLVELQGGNNFNLTLKNVEVYGLEKLKILSVKTDFDKRKARFITSLEKFRTLADYEINGRILIFPITGHGPFNMSLYNGIYECEMEWDTYMRNEKRYTKVVKTKYDYKVEKITYHFKNLFNGDKLLGTEMNRFLNENWQLVNEDLKAPFLEILSAFHNDIATKIYSYIPYDDLFLE